MSDFLELAAKRESVRGYTDQPVEREKLENCIIAAQIAPSACNSQPWSYVVVTDKELLPKVTKAVQAYGLNSWADSAQAYIIVVEETAMLMDGKGGRTPNQKYAALDIGLSVSQICLEATAQGLGTCIMGSFDGDYLKTFLPIEQEKTIRLVLSVGYPKNPVPRKKIRKDIDQVAKFL